MSLEAAQKPVNGLETPQQDPPATGATDSKVTDALKKTESSDVSSSLDNSAQAGKDAINGNADTKTVSAGQPLEAAKPKEPVEPTETFQPDEPLPKGDSVATDAGIEMPDKEETPAQDVSSNKEAKSAEKMDIDAPEKSLPASDPTTIGNVPAKDVDGQDVDQAKVKNLTALQETAKHGHDDDQDAVEEQRPAKKQRTEPVTESNGADGEAPKRSASKKKKEPKKATTEDGQPRRSSRLAI